MEPLVDDTSIAEVVKVSLLVLNHDIGILLLNIPLRLLLTLKLLTEAAHFFGRLLFELVGFGSDVGGVTLAVINDLGKLNFGDVLHVAACVCGKVAVHRSQCFLQVLSVFFLHLLVVRHLEIWVLKLG